MITMADKRSFVYKETHEGSQHYIRCPCFLGIWLVHYINTVMHEIKMLPLALAPFIISGVLAASGCGTAPPYDIGQLSDNQTVLDTRRYRVFVPPSYNQSNPTPLILSYHGANGYIESQVALDRLTDPFFNTQNIIVYLQGNAVRHHPPAFLD
jgi:poly(3-hydroxybutyrate) depolymerase